MGYDRDAPWMTCGERDDKEVTEEQLIEALVHLDIMALEDVSWLGCRELARALLSKFIILRT